MAPFAIVCKADGKSKKEVHLVTELSEIYGYPVLTLKSTRDDKKGISFGTAKAKLILDHIEEIKKFHKEYGETGIKIKFT